MLTVKDLKEFIENYSDETKVMIKSSYYAYSCTIDEMTYEPFDDDKDEKVIAIIESSQKGHID